MARPAHTGPNFAQTRLARSYYIAARPGPPVQFMMPTRPDPGPALNISLFCFYKNIHAMELNDYFHSVSEHGKYFSTIVIMSLIRLATFNACKAT
jgi:hypothetical protein